MLKSSFAITKSAGITSLISRLVACSAASQPPDDPRLSCVGSNLLPNDDNEPAGNCLITNLTKSSENWSKLKSRGGSDERLPYAAAGCFSISALILISLLAAGLSSQDNSLVQP